MRLLVIVLTILLFVGFLFFVLDNLDTEVPVRLMDTTYPSVQLFAVVLASIYAQRRTGFINALAGHGIPAMGRSGFNVWIPSPEESGVVQRLADRGWGVAAGERVRIHSAPGLRVTTAALIPEEAQRCAADFAACLRPSAVAMA